jgi:hypothetical protein
MAVMDEPQCEHTADTSTSVSGAFSIDTIFKNVHKLEVKGEFCNVFLKGNSGTELRLQGRVGNGGGDQIVMGNKTYAKSEYLIKYTFKDGLLMVWIERVHLEKRRRIEENSNSILDFTVPEGVELLINTSSGNIVMSGTTTKLADLRSRFGNITATDIHAELHLKASSGNIKAVNVQGDVRSGCDFGNSSFDHIKGNLWVTGSSGHVTVTDLTGNAEVTTSFGNQKYINVQGHLKANASSGGIRVQKIKGNVFSTTAFGTQHFEDVEGDIRSTASSGNIKIERSKGELELSTSFGSIKGNDVTVLAAGNLRASSGNISIDFANDLKDLQFDLRSSSGSVCVGEGNQKSTADKVLRLGDGSIIISGTTTFGNQSYR